jgi:hypothetical protein
MNEVWKPLVYPKIENSHLLFEISSVGRLRNIKTGHICKPEVLSSGYLSCRVTCGKRDSKIHIIIHKGVALTFLPNPNDLPCVNHIDGDKTNNCVENLEWFSYGHNLRHAYDTGLFDKSVISGENNHASKLTSEEILYIRSVYVKGSRQFGARALARKFDVNRVTIASIINGRTWANV